MTIKFAPGSSPEDAARALAGMRERLRNLQPVLAVQGESIRKLIDDSFRQSRSPDGSAWKPNAASTIARKGSAKPGIDTGIMRNSVSVQTSATTIEFGTNVPYAGPNQSGAVRTGSLKRASSRPKRPAGTAFKVVQPARPFLPFTIEGTLITIGPAAKAWQRLAQAVGAYVATGRVT